jgi:hypothetical protein
MRSGDDLGLIECGEDHAYVGSFAGPRRRDIEPGQACKQASIGLNVGSIAGGITAFERDAQRSGPSLDHHGTRRREFAAERHVLEHVEPEVSGGLRLRSPGAGHDYTRNHGSNRGPQAIEMEKGRPRSGPFRDHDWPT